MVFDQGEGSDILDAIVAEGRCRTCGTPWDRVVKVDGKRPVKIEGGCPNEVCVTGDDRGRALRLSGRPQARWRQMDLSQSLPRHH
jgi:hypothetical protein